ncbi:MAG: pseudaminic acid cytidylyltransferase [Flavobacteriales bacterium]|nr:pseudaminic acid cytidylyltransferase [Flavobacteriales bacterium]
MNSKSCICIIPARGGSKRIPRKNILPLNGKPLMAYSIEAAKNSAVFDKIVVSTEDPEIKEIALQYGVEVDDRPEHMAGDQVTKVQVINEYIQRNQIQDDYDYVAALLPTCPFRTSEDVKEAFNKISSQKEHDFLIGVTEYEFPVDFALRLNDEIVEMVNPEGYAVTRSQNKEKKYHPNGAVYIATMKGFIEKETFFNRQMMHHIMPALRSYDIDYPYQFEIAEIIAKRILNEE